MTDPHLPPGVTDADTDNDPYPPLTEPDDNYEGV